MKKMKPKRIILTSLLLALVLLFNTNVYAQGEDKTTFTVEEAVNYALAHNGDILKTKFQNEELDMSLSGIRSTRKGLNQLIEYWELTEQSVVDNMAEMKINNFDSYLLRNKVTEARLAKQKELSQKGYDMRTEMVKLNVEKAYYNVLITKISYDDAKRNCDVVKKQTDNGAIKLKYGTISEIDYKSLEISQNAAELALVQAEFAYKEAKMDLNELLGFDYNKELTLTSNLEISKTDITLTENKKEDLRKNNITFLMAEQTYNNAVEDEKYAKAYYGSNSDSYKSYKIKKQEAEITFANDKNNLERTILSSYNSLDVMQKTVKIYSDKKDLMKLALGIQEIRLKYDTATEDDVITASINYNTALNDYYNMLLNYNMLAKLFEKNIIG